MPRTSSEFGEIFEAEFDDGTPVFGVMLPFGGFGQLECTTDDSSNDSLTLLQLLIEQWDEICQEIVSRLWECDELDDLIENEAGQITAFCTVLPSMKDTFGEEADYLLLIDMGTLYHFFILDKGIMHWQPLQ